MNFTIIAVGKIKDRALGRLIDEYVRRIRHDAKLEIAEIRDATPEKEGEAILDRLRRERAAVIALGENGKLYSSREFARRISAIPKRIEFVIGGPFGLSQPVKDAADEILALSTLTFTHELARLLLVEQLYRAISIVKNRSYHKD